MKFIRWGRRSLVFQRTSARPGMSNHGSNSTVCSVNVGLALMLATQSRRPG